VPSEYSARSVPSGDIFPIRFANRSVNQRLPSVPTVIPYGPLCASGRKKSVICPSG
jgi:hypothetical protein